MLKEMLRLRRQGLAWGIQYAPSKPGCCYNGGRSERLGHGKGMGNKQKWDSLLGWLAGGCLGWLYLLKREKVQWLSLNLQQDIRRTCQTERFWYIKLHQERGQDGDGAVIRYIMGSYKNRHGVQRQKTVKTAQGKKIHQKRLRLNSQRQDTIRKRWIQERWGNGDFLIKVWWTMSKIVSFSEGELECSSPILLVLF